MHYVYEVQRLCALPLHGTLAVASSFEASCDSSEVQRRNEHTYHWYHTLRMYYMQQVHHLHGLLTLYKFSEACSAGCCKQDSYDPCPPSRKVRVIWPQPRQTAVKRARKARQGSLSVKTEAIGLVTGGANGNDF